MDKKHKVRNAVNALPALLASGCMYTRRRQKRALDTEKETYQRALSRQGSAERNARAQERVLEFRGMAARETGIRSSGETNVSKGNERKKKKKRFDETRKRNATKEEEEEEKEEEEERGRKKERKKERRQL